MEWGFGGTLWLKHIVVIHPGREVAVNMICGECTTGLDHCHGTLVIHLDGTIECTEPWCADEHGTRHLLARLTCIEVDGDCTCQPRLAELIAS